MHEPGHLYSVHEWEIDNKYYTAKVKVCTIPHEKYQRASFIAFTDLQSRAALTPDHVSAADAIVIVTQNLSVCRE